MRVALALAFAVACSPHSPPVDKGAAAKLFDEIQIDVPPGESDLTVDDRGRIWAIAERDRIASEIELHGLDVKITPHPVDGVPDGNDTEGLAWLGPGKFALGIEGQEERTAGILFADLRPDGHLVVTSTRMLTFEEMGVELQNNHGAEAICGKGDDLLVGIEERGRFPDGSRWAPLVRITSGKLSLAKLHLTTDTGKLSALDCRFAADGSVDFVGIERHYGVERILHGTVAPGAPEGSVVTPTVELDLAPTIHDTYNLEGIARLADGRWVLVNDNQSKTIDGPTKLLVLKR